MFTNKRAIEHVTEEEWNIARDQEDVYAIHPCDHWLADKCMCKGACSCHWKESLKKISVRVILNKGV